MDIVCDQLYNFYRSRETELQRFTLQFLPTLVYIYLNSAAHGDIKVRYCSVNSCHDVMKYNLYDVI